MSKKNKNKQPNFPSPSGGPQFEQPNQKNKVIDWLNKYGSTVVLPIIAVLVLAGGIYIYASQNNQEEPLAENEQNTEQNKNNEGSNITLPDENGEESESSNDSGSNDSDNIEIILPEPTETNEAYVMTAAQGDGVTHLARRAAAEYLSQHSDQASQLTKEHKIYIEDYLKDKTGSQPLEVGQEVTFSKDLIQEAINSSLNLTEQELQVIQQFSSNVSL